MQTQSGSRRALVLASLLPALAAAATMVAAAPAGAQTLTPTQVLRVHFRLKTPFIPVPPNALVLDLGNVNLIQAYGTRRATLWDCDRPLGHYSSMTYGSNRGAMRLIVAATWIANGSPFAVDNPTVVDFSSLQAGTIRGIVDFTIDSGSMTIALPQISLLMLQAATSSSGLQVFPDPVVTEAAIVPKLSGPTPGTVGTTNTWTVTSAQPSSLVAFGFGTTCGPIPVLGVTYDITPLVFVATVSNASGVATLSTFVPTFASMQRLLVQAVEIVGPNLVVTNVSAHTFP